MLNWMREAMGVGGKNDPQNLSGGADKWLEQLTKKITPIDQFKGARNGLARDIIKYVLVGEPIALINEVHSSSTVGDFLGLRDAYYQTSIVDQDPSFYEHFEQVPAVVALRWARLLTEASTGNFSMVFPGNEHWPEVLLMNASGRSMAGWYSSLPKLKYITASKFEQILVESGLNASALLVSAFSSPVKANYYAKYRAPIVSKLIGYADYLQRHIKEIQPLLFSTIVDQRLLMLELLGGAHDETLEIIANELCEFATSGSKQVRNAAEPLIRRGAATTIVTIKRIALEGKPEQRGFALRLLWMFVQRAETCEEDKISLAAFCHDTAANDKSAAIRALVEEWKVSGDSAETDQSIFTYVTPEIDWSNALTPELDNALKILWRDLNAFVDKTNHEARERNAAALAKGHKWPLHQLEPVTDGDLKELRDYLSSSDPTFNGAPRKDDAFQYRDLLSKFFTSTDMKPVALFKSIVYFTHSKVKNGLPHFFVSSFNAMHSRIGQPNLLELELMLKQVGYSANDVLKAYCLFGNGLANSWPAENVWPFFASNRELLVQHLVSGLSGYSYDRKKLYQAIGVLPQPFDEVI